MCVSLCVRQEETGGSRKLLQGRLAAQGQLLEGPTVPGVEWKTMSLCACVCICIGLCTSSCYGAVSLGAYMPKCHQMCRWKVQGQILRGACISGQLLGIQIACMYL